MGKAYCALDLSHDHNLVFNGLLSNPYQEETAQKAHN